jgi:hypothetical protein
VSRDIPAFQRWSLKGSEHILRNTAEPPLIPAHKLRSIDPHVADAVLF